MRNTFKQMLAVLQGDAEGPDDARLPLQSGRSRRGWTRKRGRSRHAGIPLMESLERRKLLAVSTFATLSNNGLVTIVAEGGDDVFIQQVGGSQPYSLFVADNSSFQNRSVVGGPSVTLSPSGNAPGIIKEQFFPSVDFASFDRLIITAGSERVETVPQQWQGYPSYNSLNTTAFAMPVYGEMRTDDLLAGLIAIKQSNGEIDRWAFSNAFPGSSSSGAGLPTLRSGPGITESLNTGDIRPVGFSVETGRNGDRSRGARLVVTWSGPVVTAPTLESISWRWSGSFEGRFRVDTNLTPASPATAFIGLPNSTGRGINPIVKSTFLGQLTVGEGTPDSRTFQLSSDETGLLYFDGAAVGSFAQDDFLSLYRGNASVGPFIRGQVVTGEQLDPGTGSYPRGIRLFMSTAYPVKLDFARYAVSDSGSNQTISATVFAGHDITASVNINLLNPGSAINIDSPIKVNNTRAVQAVTLRATSVDLNAAVTVESDVLATKQDFKVPNTNPQQTLPVFAIDTTNPGRLEVGPAITVSQTGFERATAIAQVVDGQVKALTIPPGLGGAGYSTEVPPRVEIAAPEARTARAVITGLSGGIVNRLVLTNAGAGYNFANPPRVSFVGGGGSGASADATVVQPPASSPTSLQSLAAITLTKAGSGYSSNPTVLIDPPSGTAGTQASAAAIVRGGLDASRIAILDGGSGYQKNSRINVILSSTTGSGAVAYAVTDNSGSISSIIVENAGNDYEASTTTIAFPAPDDTASLRAAAAEPIIDPGTGRIVSFKITDNGAGYNGVPDVTISPPLLTTSAGVPFATIANGEVTSIALSSGSGLVLAVKDIDAKGGALSAYVVADNQGQYGGRGYLVGDIVAIDGGLLGRSAQFKVLQVSSTGAVQRVQTASPGADYVVGESLAHDGVANKGLGYTLPPKVVVALPSDPAGRPAKARAVIDGLGSVVGFEIDDPGSGYSVAPAVSIAGLTPGAIAETLRINARAAAGAFDITLADDPFSDSVNRSLLLVSRAGSMQADVRTRATATDFTRAARIRAEIHQGDVRIEGLTNADLQSWLLQSSPGDLPLAPFIFSTDAIGSGVATGRIMGDTVAITLANDLPTPENESVALNEVTLSTDIDSIRVRAASAGRGEQPFPYRIKIDEFDSIAIEAVAASSFPIALQSGGPMSFLSANATAGGFEVFSSGKLSINAPMTTTSGSINLVGQSLEINSSVRVLNGSGAGSAEAPPDILLDASGGDITIRGGVVEAPGRVAIRQKTVRAPLTRTYRSLGAATPILAGQTVSRPILVPDDFTFDALSASVSLSITDALYGLSDVRISLVPPAIGRYTLLDQFRLPGTAKALLNTQFSPESPNRIDQGTKEPYTGTFQPTLGNGLTTLYNRASAVSTWLLEVTALNRGTQGAEVGRLTGFELTLRDPQGGTAGDVYGDGIIIADSLLIDAEGAIGNNSKQPKETEFYLRTQVNTVEASSLKSISLSDTDDILISSLRANGLVSLAAGGVDTADRAALSGTLTDIPALDVNAPNGSIDLQIFSASTLTLGNEPLLALPASLRTGLDPMRAAGSVSIQTVGGSQGGDIVVLDAPLAGSSGRTVRTVTTAALPGVYSSRTPGVFPATITASAPGSLSSILNQSLSSSLAAGDRILVTKGTTQQPQTANGIYTVRQLGSASTKWELIRAADADTLPEFPSRTFVTALEGPNANKSYQISHAMTSPLLFGTDAIGVVEVSPTTRIGSDDPLDGVSFVVSTTDGTNTSPGSLGKMLSLRQSVVNINPNALLFSANISSAIRLTQELPIISSSITIDGKSRYPAVSGAPAVFVDGSKIVLSRTNRSVGPTTLIDGFVFGPASAGSSIQNVIVGGFSRGAGVKVDGGSKITMSAVTLGIDNTSSATRLANKYSLQLVNATDVTISNSTIAGGSVAGLSLEGTTSGVAAFGNTFGTANSANTVAISMAATGANSIGSLTGPRNQITNCATGIDLKNGSVTVQNTSISECTNDAITISGGKHFIGTTTTANTKTSNEISNNRGWGVSISNTTVAAGQTISGNYFARLGSATGLGTNALGAISVGKAKTTIARWVANASTGVDPDGNIQAAATSGTGGGSGGGTGGGTGNPRPTPRPPSNVRTPWRRR